MNRQHVIRRIVLGAAVMGLAVLTLGPVQDTLATPQHGSKTEFKSYCEALGGVFIDAPEDNLTACFFTDGSKEVCDTFGGNCSYYPAPKKQEEPSWADPLVGAPVDAPLVADDSQTVAPVDAAVDAPLEMIAEAPVDTPVENQGASAAESGTLAAPVEAAPVILSALTR